jgi:hypothetical protein
MTAIAQSLPDAFIIDVLAIAQAVLDHNGRRPGKKRRLPPDYQKV